MLDSMFGIKRTNNKNKKLYNIRNIYSPISIVEYKAN